MRHGLCLKSIFLAILIFQSNGTDDISTTHHPGHPSSAGILSENNTTPGEPSWLLIQRNAKNYDKHDTKFLNSFFDGYDKRIRPNNEREPVVTTINVYVNSIGQVEEATMDYTLNIFLRRRWNDPRLAYSNDPNQMISLHPSMLDKLWEPDVFFSNEKKASFHKVTNDNKLLRIYGNGDVYSSVRLSLTLACNMFLHYFPMDIQICSLDMESFAHDTSDLLYKWDDSLSTQPIQFSDHLVLPQFKLQDFVTFTDTKHYQTGNFTSLGAMFILERQMGYYLIQMYIPSMLIVILSWVSFWININAAPARTALGITTVLTMSTQSAGVRSALPKVSYIKAIDIWFSFCLFSVFAALIEYALVNFMSRAERNFIAMINKRKLKRAKARQAGDNELEKALGDDIDILGQEEAKALCLKKAEAIDQACRYMFPIIFVVFNLFYWSIYLYRRGQEKNQLAAAYDLSWHNSL